VKIEWNVCHPNFIALWDGEFGTIYRHEEPSTNKVILERTPKLLVGTFDRSGLVRCVMDIREAVEFYKSWEPVFSQRYLRQEREEWAQFDKLRMEVKIPTMFPDRPDCPLPTVLNWLGTIMEEFYVEVQKWVIRFVL
jgi:hypothetical protein